MLKLLVLIFLPIFGAAKYYSETDKYYSETYDDLPYQSKPECNPETLKENVTCASLGSSVPSGGGLFVGYDLLFDIMSGAYYAARVADALGYYTQCPTNRKFLADMDLTTPWSGQFGSIAVDAAFGNDRFYQKKCSFPTGPWPFLCTGAPGNPPHTHGERLGTVSYVSILHDEVNFDWTLFGVCFNPKTPEFPNRVETAVSFNVFSLNTTISQSDIQAIKTKLASFGFSTAAANIIQPDYESV